MEWIIAAALGGLVGAGELVARYRDAPGRALVTAPGAAYVLVNLVASATALGALRSLDVRMGFESGPAAAWAQTLSAGLGSMAVLRTSFFTARRGEQDFHIGPSGFLQILLDAADRSVDRSRARERSETVSRLMTSLSFSAAEVALPAYCLALMQNVSRDEQEVLARQIAELRRSDTDDPTKSRILGLTLMNLVGRDVLSEAIVALGDEAAGARSQLAQSASR